MKPEKPRRDREKLKLKIWQGHLGGIRGDARKGKVRAKEVPGNVMDLTEQDVDPDGRIHANLWTRLHDADWSPGLLAALIDSADEVEALLGRIWPGLHGRELETQKNALWEAIQRAQGLRSRKMRKVVSAVGQPRLFQGTTGQSTGEVYNTLLAENVELARSVYKSKYKRSLQQEGADQRGVEEQERRRWAMVIAGLIRDAKLPAAAVAEQTADPESTWLRLCGNRRARTLRQSARTWSKVTEWLGLACGEVWPSSFTRIIDYLEERSHEDCGHTLPGSVLSALQLMEAVGGVPPEDKMGSSPLLNNVVRSLTTQLASGAKPKKSAPLYTVAMVIAAELLVADAGASEIARILAFVFLLMIWCALRTDDVLWIDRSRLYLSDIGLRGVLMRSKRRRVRELPIFVVRTTSLSGQDWLQIGMDLYQQAAERFPGVQFLCTPRKDLEGFTRKYLVSATLMGWLHWMLLQLKTPRRLVGTWHADPEDSLIDMELGTHWSGHSARHCLPSWAAAIGIDGERRAFVGRWKAGVEVDHNTYVLTARQIVHGVQEEVLKAMCTGEPKSFFEVEVMGELVQYAADRNIPREAIRSRHMIWKRRFRTVALFQDFPMIADETWGMGALPTGEGDEEPNAGILLEGEDNTQDAPYWVSVSRKSGFRRLHRVGGCSVRPETVHRAEPVHSIHAHTADKKCQVCWKKEAAGEDSSSSSGSSSSSSEESGEL